MQVYCYKDNKDGWMDKILLLLLLWWLNEIYSFCKQISFYYQQYKMIDVVVYVYLLIN